MIALIVLLILFLVAVIGGLTAGLLQTSRLLSVIFYVLASGAAVKYLFPERREQHTEKQRRRPKFQQASDGEEDSLPPPPPEEPAITRDTADMIANVEHLLQDPPAASAAVKAAAEGPHSRIPNHAQLRELGAYEIIGAGMTRKRGHELTLRPKKDGIFQARECRETVYVTLPDPLEGVGANLVRHGIQDLFVLRDEQNQVIPTFPSGRLEISVDQDAECRFYDAGRQLALMKKGTVYVTRK